MDETDVQRRDGWARRKVVETGKWGPWEPDKPAKSSLPAGVVPPLGAFADDLDASHVRITKALAIATRRLELAAPAGLNSDELDALEQLARVWRTLEANIEKTAERVIEKAIAKELKRLGPNEQPEEHGSERRRVGDSATDEADSPGE